MASNTDVKVICSHCDNEYKIDSDLINLVTYPDSDNRYLQFWCPTSPDDYTIKPLNGEGNLKRLEEFEDSDVRQIVMPKKTFTTLPPLNHDDLLEFCLELKEDRIVGLIDEPPGKV